VKRLHHYEDGTLKVVYDNGTVDLMFSGVKDIETKFLVKVDGKIFTIPIAGGIPVRIDSEADARWVRLSGSSAGELIYKAIVNSGMTVARTISDRASRALYQCLKSFRPSICGE
jgi:hypothetical protein